jgi:HlyD family secretion protein
MGLRKSLWRALSVVGVLGAVVVVIVVARRGTPPDVPTAQLTRSDFVEFVEIRGDIRPYKSVVVTAPMQSGELQILKIAPNGTAVKKDDVVIVFDESTVRRMILDRQSELRQAEAELQQFRAQMKNVQEQDATALMHADYDVQRARLGLGDPRVTSKVDLERAKLALADSEEKLKEVRATDRAHRASAAADAESRQRRLDKLRADIERIQASIGALEVKAPANGTVNIMLNYRASSPMGSPPEFRQGDKAFPGAQILELPDLTSIHLAARLDEADRGRLSTGQPAMIKVDAIADRQFQATVADISLLARADFSSWPPTKNFDLKLAFKDLDGRLRPGMSAAARIEVSRSADMLVLPASAVFPIDGRPTIFKLVGTAFQPVAVEVVKRNREQVAIKGLVAAGDLVALSRPDQPRPKAAR